MRVALTVWFMTGLGWSFQGSSLFAQQETPEDVAQRYVSAMQAADWDTMAGLMDQSALKSMRDLLSPLFDLPEAAELRQRFLGVETVDEAAALSDTAVFARFMQFVGSQEPSLQEALKTSRMRVIGHIPEGGDTVHVVYRMTMTVEGITMTRLDVFSLRQHGETWRGLLAGDVSALAAALRAALEPYPDPR